MDAKATITLVDERIEIRCEDAQVREDRKVSGDDLRQLKAWGERYAKLTRGEKRAPGDLLEMGEEIFRWLDGSTGALRRMADAGGTPLLVEYVVAKTDESERARAFLGAPWELVARDGVHWALREDIVFSPVRRIGKAGKPHDPDTYRLSAVFMAAAPRGADNLDYEAEEASIIRATRGIEVDLVVEESGTLEFLGACVAREKPHVVQISCHGTLKPRPGLLMEDEIGDPDFVDAKRLVSRLGTQHLRLLFLSACETAKSDPVLDALAPQLARSGPSAVLGWGAPVLDNEASIFASNLFRRLTEGEATAHAVAYARLELAESEELPENPAGATRSRDWHLIRLYLAPDGGGALATAGGPRRLTGRGHAVKTFLDAKGQQVPVAGELEFVGRRREIQSVLREFRAPADERHAGVLIHGLGRQGKSSLAARVAQRMEHTHDAVVIYGRYDAPAVLSKIRDGIGRPGVTEIVDRYMPTADGDHSTLFGALVEIIEGPCAQRTKDGNCRPMLLVIDDFEQALEKTPTGARHSLKPELIESVRAVIKAFNNRATESRLILTSRYEFTLPDADGRELTELLFDRPLKGMEAHEAGKQASAKFRAQIFDRKVSVEGINELLPRMGRIREAAQGNPGLQDMMFGLCLENPDACDTCLSQMEEYRETGKAPDEDHARQFMENLAIGSLIALLTDEERKLLRASTVFGLPVPTPVMTALAKAVGGDRGAVERLVALGMMEVYEDIYDSRHAALAINALVSPAAGELGEGEARALAAAVSVPLFERWGAEKGGAGRPSVLDYELTRLALIAREARVLAAATADALRYLEDRFEYRTAAAWGAEAVSILDEAEVAASIDLLRRAAERCDQVGDVAKAEGFVERALEAINGAHRRGEEVNREDHGRILVIHARFLVQRGRPDEAMGFMEQAREMLASPRERAIVLGYIARLMASKGEVDRALEMHQEMVGIFESLGDKRSRAVTLGDIARLMADKGEVDRALEMHKERLAVAEAMGDMDSRASALWDTAQIEIGKEEWQGAFSHMAESYGIFVKLGRLDGICVVGVSLGQLMCMGGQRDEGLEVLKRSQEGFTKLGQGEMARQTQELIDQIEGS